MTNPQTTLMTQWERAISALRGEVAGLSPKLEWFKLKSSISGVASPTSRAEWLRQVGYAIGARTRVEGTPDITGSDEQCRHLVVGEECTIDVNCVFDLEEKITLGNRVTLGPGAMILTSTHDLGPQSHRAGVVTRSPVTVGDGAWIGARAIVLPGVTIGAGAIVEVGAVVNKDVAPHTRVGGLPAVVLEKLDAT